MNLRILYLLILLPFFAVGQEGNFKWQNPLPQGNDLNAVSCTSGRFAWAVGTSGTIIKSKDKGVTWEIQNSGITNQLTSVSFIDSLHGFVGGVLTLLKTADGGQTWEQNNLTQIGIVNDIQFPDEENGWAVTSNGKILHTNDGGNTWIYQFEFYGHNLRSIYFTDTLNGYAAGANGEFLRTENSGQTWEILDNFSIYYHFKSLFFTHPDTGYMCGNYYYDILPGNVILKTTDRGTTWSETWFGATSPDMNDIFFSSSENGYIAASRCVVYETHNRGESWEYTSWGNDEYLTSISFFNQHSAVCVGWDCQILRKLGGPFYFWKLNESGTTECINDICFTSETRGWAVGDYTLLETSDGGESWNEFKITGVDSRWQSIYFLDDNLGWITGTWGDLYHTDNGGNTWDKQLSLTNRELYAVFFTDENYGWAVGQQGYMILTPNGGQNWFIYPTPIWYNVRDVFFIDRFTGWIVGSDGSIYKSTDGGFNWTDQNSSTTFELYSVFFRDALEGWIVGDCSVVLHTINGGDLWESQSLSAYGDLRDVLFIDDLNGWICGENGVMFSTIDGGQNWTNESFITINDLNAVFFQDNNSGWFCGDNGSIIAYSNSNPVELPDRPIKNRSSSIYVTPNPCSAEMHLKFNNKINRIRIYDMRGTLIRLFSVNHIDQDSHEMKIETKYLTKGVYVLEASSDEKSESIKFIKN